MEEKKQQQPFKKLGEKLKDIRQKLNKTTSDVSCAVEIDEIMLAKIEQGHERPSEDILMLLINHFCMREDDATHLWHLAGYEPPRHQRQNLAEDMLSSNKAMLLLAIDPRVIYSDGVQIHANNGGIIMTFSQGTGTPGSMATSKIGMSRDQALLTLQALQDVLQHDKPKQSPDKKSKK